MTSDYGLSKEECLVCDRVSTEEFYGELRKLGFEPEDARLALN